MHNFIDPSLKRVSDTWEDLVVPDRLRALADRTWQLLDRLAVPGGDTPEVATGLDEVRARYSALYDEAVAIAQSSVLASRRHGMRLQAQLAAEEAKAAQPRRAWRHFVPGPVKRLGRTILGRG